MSVFTVVTGALYLELTDQAAQGLTKAGQLKAGFVGLRNAGITSLRRIHDAHHVLWTLAAASVVVFAVRSIGKYLKK